MYSSHNDGASRAGFTLIEMMIAIIITGLLAGVLFQMLQGQGRMTEVQGARAEIQQNSRGTIELISSELRSIGPLGLTTGASEEIEFRVPIIWGVVCAASSGGLVVLFDTAEVALPSSAAEGVVVRTAPDTWTQGAGAAVSATTSTACNVMNFSGDDLVVREVGTSLSGAAPPVGAPVYLYHRLRYYSAADASGRHWVYRSERGAAGQPLAGPLDEGGPGGEPFAFEYFSGPSTQVTGNISESGGTASPVNMIRLKARMRSQSEAVIDGGPARDSASIFVHLRNRT